MDKETRRPSHPTEKGARWTSRPASPHRDDILEAQTQTHDPLQPLQSLTEGPRISSPLLGALEKAMDPSLASHPGNSAPSTTSSLSRASTLNSTVTTQSQDTTITECSGDSAYSDDTLSESVTRSLTLPVTSTFPSDRMPRPTGGNFRILDSPTPLFDQQSLFSYGSIVPAPFHNFGPGSIPGWLGSAGKEDDIGFLAYPYKRHHKPTRHLTFPIEESRNPTRTNSASSLRLKDKEYTEVLDTANMDHPAPRGWTIQDTDARSNDFWEDCIPNQTDLGSLQSETGMHLKAGLHSDEGMTRSLDYKHDDVRHESFTFHSGRIPARREKRSPWNIVKARKAPERATDGVARQSMPDNGPRCSNDSGVWLIDSPDTSLEAALGNGVLNRAVPQMEGENDRPSHPPSPGDERKLPCHDSREPISPESDDKTVSLYEDSGAESEDDEDSAYNTLVQSITCLVVGSPAVGNAEERGVPVELYVHSFLEQILSHSKPAAENQTPLLPVYNLPMHTLPRNTNDGPGNLSDWHTRADGQGENGGRRGGQKRPNEEPHGQSRNGDDGGGNDPCDSSEDQSRTKKAKKLKTGRKSGLLSCPFRKRNPTRFNVRNHGGCALAGFPSLSLLKRHIQNIHKKTQSSISCLRCQQTFPDQTALRIHLTQPQSCSVVSPSGDDDPEDGITDEVLSALTARKREDSIREWPDLWHCLFPEDDLGKIPESDHEPPVEWDEVREHCYHEDSLHKFVNSIAGEQVITEHGFRYLVEGLGQSLDTRFEKHSKGRPYRGEERHERDKHFVSMVNTLLDERMTPSRAQQTESVVVCEPPQEVSTDPSDSDFNNQLNFGLDYQDIFNSQFPMTYPNNPAYNSYTGFGFENASNMPAPKANAHFSSEGAMQAGPLQPLIEIPLMARQNGGRPSSPAEGSGRRLSARYSSSGLSSQRSRDSGDLLTLRTEETGETQSTQYTPFSQDPQFSQDQAAMLHHQQQCHPHPEDGESGEHTRFCSCSTFPSGIPPDGQGCATAMPSQGSSELRGIGEDRTSAFAPGNSLYINSDEEFSPGADSA
ncbi:hypothetical protein KVR01_007293 [Diaporthe batatas]|uniref:uncharacterized protein n=1 Tax=Diaporthe batatas TaxID=748121 RepID=UPI001D03D0ED|nr:uncharacterized protein KVR01_007293 [Diaporthe batatas]KAG8162815.1 hypothetical protein KVR01_007293 [Diaporthe batatas]